MFIQHMLNKPESLRLSAKEYLALARRNGYGVDTEEQIKIRGLRNRELAKLGNTSVPKEQRGTIGGLQTWAERRSRAALVARKRFGPHAAYVIGLPVVQASRTLRAS